MTSATKNQSLCLQCYVHCPRDPFGRCTHCGAKDSPVKRYFFAERPGSVPRFPSQESR